VSPVATSPERSNGDSGNRHGHIKNNSLAGRLCYDCRATFWENAMANEKGPNIKKKQICKNCEGKGLLKKGDRVVKCQRCKGTGVR
jgi:DnaJ-class molecular chaperone